MSEKRFIMSKNVAERDHTGIIDVEKQSLLWVIQVVDLLNEQQTTIDKQNELIKLIAKACTYSKEHSVKEILRKKIRGIDTVTEESANAWHDYIILSKFFEEQYGEHWDNFD